MVLGIQHDMRTALAHARVGRTTTSGLSRYYYLQEAQSLINSAGTRAVLALKRVDDPDVVDDGTKVLLMRVVKWADASSPEPLDLFRNDLVITAVNRWVVRTSFPEKEYLRRTYAVPGRWQRPPEDDIER
jgi:hypothetical protein